MTAAELMLALLLAQTCVAEIDLQPSADECVMMWEINDANAIRRRISLGQQTREFNSYWKVKHTSRAWIGALTLGTREPAGWSVTKRGPWVRSALSWGRYVEAARLFLAWRSEPQNRRKAPKCRAVDKPRRWLLVDSYGGTPGDGKGADDPAPCPYARRVQCLPDEQQAYWATGDCRVARVLSARKAAGK